MLMINWCLNAMCNNCTSIKRVVDYKILSEFWQNALLVWQNKFCVSPSCYSIHLVPCCPNCSFDRQRTTVFTVCTTLLSSASLSYDDIHLSHFSSFMCLHLPTFAITLGNLIYIWGNTCSSLSGKRITCCVAIKVCKFFMKSSLLYFVPAHSHFVIGHFIFPSPSSTIHPSVHPFVNKSIHQSPEDRNASPALLSSIWWACY